jgi:hypothetical protein
VASKAKSYETWKKEFANWIHRNRKLEILECASLGVSAEPGESERDFRVRLQQIARERRDEAVERLRQKYAPKFAALEDRRLRAEQAVEREAQQAQSHKTQTAISFGATILSSFMGRKALSLSTLGRATTAARSASRSQKEAEDVARAQESLGTIVARQAELNDEFRSETAELEQSLDPQNEPLETVSLKPTKPNIEVRLLTLAWVPYWKDAQGQTNPAWN